MRHATLRLLLPTALVLAAMASAPAVDLAFAPAPPDNPLKGLCPYQGGAAGFPHSLEFNYLRWADLMTGPDAYDWGALDGLMARAAANGCQTVFRVYIDWPGRPAALPDHLRALASVIRRPASGVEVTNYEDAGVRAAMRSFIAALGRRYDGDPRVGDITAGLLGFFGEWNTWPYTDLAPSPAVQVEIMDAFAAAFTRTPVLLRYGTPETARRPVGYHDDSFCWDTLGAPGNFLPQLVAVGAQDAWRAHPIGGETRPELWSTLWNPPTVPQYQDMTACIEQTHATWMMDSSIDGALTATQRDRALAAARRFGYELHVATAAVAPVSGGWQLTATVRNTGVAPFYQPWPVVVGVLDAAGNAVATTTPGWSLTGLLPGDAPRAWTTTVATGGLGGGTYTLAVRVPNPMAGGRPLRFANAAQQQGGAAWLPLITASTAGGPTATPPGITAQPLDRAVVAGATATFSVTATGSPAPIYQWRRDGVSIAGATGSTWTTPATTVADSGARFDVVVANSAGSATSAAATLTVSAAPTGGYAPGLKAEFFDFASDLAVLPDLTARRPDVVRTDARIAYATVGTAWSGLPAGMADTFASRHTGFLRIDVAGSYTLSLTSDDGSRAWLDGALVIDNDGVHGMVERSATLALSVGWHPLRVEFFENAWGAGLELRWQGPGIAKDLVPASALWQADPTAPALAGGDIGDVGAAGSSAFADGRWTVRGSGWDIWGDADAFRFISRPVVGDVRITARVDAMDATDGWAKAGVMLRESTASVSRHAFTAVTPANGVAFQRRLATGGVSDHTAGPARSAPYWVRLERIGDTVWSSCSSDGIAWQVVGQIALAGASRLQVGLAVTSHRRGVVCGATFSQVSIVVAPTSAN